ncbi:MAG: cytochrome c biogenesis protein CcsA [Woeseia sp.]|nr:cytochrome c biogenesis protein CcsA [Woeseia sp.]MBT8097638.1 cytochrome c biogenesis protein CcsA [Woeseia sp.]NNL55684.1 cytochrome c biogenesis protein CcsA [Woeseia sp.]
MSRLPRYADTGTPFLVIGVLALLTGIVMHSLTLIGMIVVPDGIQLSLANSASFVGLQLAVIALLGSLDARLRGLAGGLLLLAAVAAIATGAHPAGAAVAAGWSLQAHVLISLFAYGLLSVGAIVAIFALAQDHRLRARNLNSINALFAPLETTERLLFGITTAGFLSLFLAVLSGFLFVNDLFAQHLVHKTVLSIAALLVFGVLLAGRRFAGWRGRRAVSLYLWGFVILCLAYFGSRFVLEIVLNRSWG